MQATLLRLVFVILLVAKAGIAFAEKPNVLFLFTDDQRADTIAALGNQHIQTPTLDEIARRGFVFQNAYCLGSNSGAVCLPSRNMLLSGRAYFRFGRYASGKEPNLPKSLKEAGYVTWHYGKTGNTAKDIHKQFHFSHYTQDGKERTCGQPGKEIVDGAIDFLEMRQDQRPFFLYLAFGNPHDPRVADPEYMDLYQTSEMPLPKNYLPVHPFNNGEMTVRDEKLAPWPRTEQVVRKHLHDYYATITAMDHHIGRLIAYLKQTGQYENTLIVFSSDHGLAIGSHGLFGKQSVYEHSMKSPLIFAGPGVKQGKSEALCYLLDIYPTICDLAGVPVPKGIDGQSLAPIIRGEKDSVRDSLFLSYKNVQRAVRNDRFKLIRYPVVDQTQLFDLKNDPDELHNLAGSEQYAGQVQELLALMKDWQQKLGDDSPLTVPKPQDPAFVPPGS